MRTTLGRKIVTIMSGIILAAAMFINTPAEVMAYQPTVGIVSAAAAKVRKEPNTSSDVVGSVLKGSSVTVTDEVTDSAGSKWYKVTFEGNTGYIRSDLLIKATVSTPNTVQTTTQTVPVITAGSKPAATTATPIAETKAYVNYKSVVVRQGASTDHEVMGSVTENTSVIITGEANGANGRKWYQIRYTNQSGREVIGFVRADLLTVGDPPAAAAAPEAPADEPAEPAPEEGAEAGAGEGGEGTEAPEGEEAPPDGSEEAPTEAPAEAPAEDPAPAEPQAKPDYEMVFTQNDQGVEEWFLYDHVNGTRPALSNLQAAAEAGANRGDADEEELSVQKIIIIALGAAVAILVIVIVLLLFKIKDLNDDEYDDDDDDDDDEEDDDDDEEDDDEEDDEEEEKEKKKPRKRSMADSLKAVNNAGSAKIAREKEKGITIKNVEYIPEEEPFEPGRPVVSKPQTKRKAKNFLIDDDEFEFEFLNMDDRN